MFKLLALLGCLLVGCAAPTEAAPPLPGAPTAELNVLPPIEIALHVSTSFTPEQAGAIVAATEQWQQATAGRVHFAIEVTDEPGGVQVRPVVAADIESGAFPATARVGQVDCVGCYPTPMLLNRNLIFRASTAATQAALVQTVVMHELGHVLGLEHQATGLMQAADDDGGVLPCVDAATLEAFCSVAGGCYGAAPTCGGN